MTRDPFDLVNGFKAALREGRRQIGLWQALANPYTAEICSGAGFDWLLFDGEHAPNTVPMLLAQLQAVAPYPVHPVARLPVGETALIKQYLDIGFQTLLIPFVESAAQAAEIVRAVRYAPRGVRGIGVGLSRAARWNRVPDYLNRADDEICLIVQVESAAGLANLDAILATDGVDAVFIGPADLSAALDYRGRAGHPDMVAIVDDALRRIVASGRAAGTLAMDPASVARALAAGCTFVAVGTDIALLAKGAGDLARETGAGGQSAGGGY